jgi:hypothetical protein
VGDEYDKRAVLWTRVKAELLSENGNRYFANIKDSEFPTLEGWLVSATPKEHPSEFLVTMPGSDVPEVTLKLQGRLAQPLQPGVPVSFTGTLKEFNVKPFMLTFEVQTVNRATVPATKTAPQAGKKSKQQKALTPAK